MALDALRPKCLSMLTVLTITALGDVSYTLEKEGLCRVHEMTPTKHECVADVEVA